MVLLRTRIWLNWSYKLANFSFLIIPLFIIQVQYLQRVIFMRLIYYIFKPSLDLALFLYLQTCKKFAAYERKIVSLFLNNIRRAKFQKQFCAHMLQICKVSEILLQVMSNDGLITYRKYGCLDVHTSEGLINYYLISTLLRCTSLLSFLLVCRWR